MENSEDQSRLIQATAGGGLIMARVFPIASGSDGNCILIGIAGRKFLIDAGISCERISSALYDARISPSSIDAIFITHEHEDHIRGLEVFQKRFHKPLYTTNGTARALVSRQLSSDG